MLYSVVLYVPLCVTLMQANYQPWLARRHLDSRKLCRMCNKDTQMVQGPAIPVKPFRVLVSRLLGHGRGLLDWRCVEVNAIFLEVNSSQRSIGFDS